MRSKTQPSTAPTRKLPDEIHIRAIAKDQSLGRVKNNLYDVLPCASTSSIMEINLVLA